MMITQSELNFTRVGYDVFVINDKMMMIHLNNFSSRDPVVGSKEKKVVRNISPGMEIH